MYRRTRKYNDERKRQTQATRERNDQVVRPAACGRSEPTPG